MDTLAVKYRPQTFDEVVEQDVIKAILQNQIASNSVLNAYLFSGPAGCGKAQPMYSKILTPNGFITMADVRAGTEVITRKGKTANVSKVYPQGERDIYEIEFSDYTRIRVADNHLNSVYLINSTGGVEEKVLSTLELIKLFNSQQYAICVDTPDVEFTEKTLPINPYAVGCYVVSGLAHVGNVPYDELIKMCECDDGVTFPKEYLTAHRSARLDMFYGFMDMRTGESRVRETHECQVCTVLLEDETLSDDFAFLVRSLGYIDSIECTYYPYQGMTFLHTITIQPYERAVQKTITSIKFIAEQECQCIYVDDEDHTYISDDFIPTHNTTNARLFASKLNDGIANPMELDAASHNGVDDIRSLIDDSRFMPIGCKYRTYIVDECHSLSNQAWQAFLKTLEEPVPTSIFILCTTDPQKIPATIISRVQPFNFQKISYDGIVNRLIYILESENNDGAQYRYDRDAVEYIAKLSEGGMRNAITLMEKVLGYSSNLTMQAVVDALGTIDYSIMFDLTDAVMKMDKKKVISIVETAYRTGADLKQFIKNYSNFILDLCKYRLFEGSFDYLQIPNTYKDRFSYSNAEYEFFTTLLNEVINLNASIKWDSSPKPLIESTFLLLCSEG